MERLIKVTGRGRLSLKPDTVRLRIDLIDQDREYDRAIRSSALHSQELREAFTDFGFDPSDIKTLSFRVDTEYESYQDKEDNSWKQRLVGYKAYHMLKIEFPTERESIGRIFAMVAGLSGKPEFYVEYTVKDTEGARNELLKNAVADSKLKAEVLAEAAGVRLGEIATIDYSWGEVEFVARPMNKMSRALMAEAAVEDSMDFDVVPDDIKVDDTVTVVWSLK
ncbi:MAG: SIMPL domain-containing protein [Lachnospiraceae bacterium]|nr:SIMPL domain-containing protein [Lachnospiraceae bacterium]